MYVCYVIGQILWSEHRRIWVHGKAMGQSVCAVVISYKTVLWFCFEISNPCRHVDMWIFLISKWREFEFSPVKDKSEFRKYSFSNMINQSHPPPPPPPQKENNNKNRQTNKTIELMELHVTLSSAVFQTTTFTGYIPATIYSKILSSVFSILYDISLVRHWKRKLKLIKTVKRMHHK